MTPPRLQPPATAGSCRLCPVSCDRLVYPSGCLQGACDRLYAYEEEGRTYVGCVERVFTVEIDLERFREAQATRVGFGGLRVAREPLPMCQCGIDRTYPHRATGPCSNEEFLDSAPAHAPGLRDPAAVPDR